MAHDPVVLTPGFHVRQAGEFHRCASCGEPPPGRKVFLGHGGTAGRALWPVLHDAVVVAGLDPTEFGKKHYGRTVNARLIEMLDQSGLALLLMTSEDEQRDGTERARQNVIHEVGLCQGHLGFEQVMVLREKTCTYFSNLDVEIAEFDPGRLTELREDIESFVRCSPIGPGDPVQTG